MSVPDSAVMEGLEGVPPEILPPLPVAERKRKREPRKAIYIKKILDNDVATKLSSFNKRKPTLKKKAFELQTLCDVPVCMVCYDSNGNVDTWPENRHEVISLINGYKKAKDREKRGGDAIGLLESTKTKLVAKVRENSERNCEEVASGLCRLFEGLPSDALADSLCVLDSKLKLIKERMEGGMLLKAGSCQRKELFNQGGDLHENSDIGLQVADDQTSLDVSDYAGTMMTCPYELENCNNPILGNVDDVITPNCFQTDNCLVNCDQSYGWLDDVLLVDGNNPIGGFLGNVDDVVTPNYFQSDNCFVNCDLGWLDDVLLADGNNPMDGFVGNVDDVVTPNCFQSDNCLVNCDQSYGWLDDVLLLDGNNPLCQSTTYMSIPPQVVNGGFASLPPQQMQSHGYPWTMEGGLFG